jgi:trigger factor
MVEESKDPGAGTSAVADAPGDDAPESPHGPKPITLERDALTPEARAQAEEQSGKPAQDLPYEVRGEETRPHSVLSLRFEVPADTVTAELNRYYDGLRREVTLPGFRKGKAPVKLLRIRMGKDGDQEAMQEIAVNVVRQEVGKRELKLVGDAQIVSWTLEDGRPLELEIHLEIQPDIKLQKYKGLEVEVERVDFRPEMVEQELDQLRSRHARQESATGDHKVVPGDTLVVDIAVTGQGGKELAHMGRQNLVIRDFRHELPAELADQIEGKKAGDSVSADIQTERKNRRGESITHTDTYTLTIRDIKVQKLPDLDDEFAKDLGEHDTLAELRAALESQIRARIEDANRSNSLRQLMVALVENNPVDAPRSLVGQAQYQGMMNDSMQLARMGLRLEDVIQDSEAYFARQHAEADMLIKQGLLRAELAKVEKLEVAEEDLEKEIARMGEEQGRKALAVRARLEADKKLDSVREELLSKRITEFLLENNAVRLVEPKPREPESAGDAEVSEEKPAKKTAAKKKPAAKAAKSGDDAPKTEKKPAKRAKKE